MAQKGAHLLLTSCSTPGGHGRQEVVVVVEAGQGVVGGVGGGGDGDGG